MAATSRKSANVRLSPDGFLRLHLIELLKGGNAHVGLPDAVEDFPSESAVPSPTDCRTPPGNCWNIYA